MNGLQNQCIVTYLSGIYPDTLFGVIYIPPEIPNTRHQNVF